MQPSQNQINVQEFLDTEVVDFASYSTVRAIASVVDGLKNAGRKVIYSMKRRPNKEAKVSILSGIIMSTCLTYDTEVILENGSSIKIGDWSTKYPDKKMNVQCVDSNGNKAISVGHSPRETKRTDKLYHITIDNEIISCTEDHKFMVKNSKGVQWIEAKNLKEGNDIVSYK